MEVTDFLQAIFRWIHIVAGIIWIGHLYFFNFVNSPFAGHARRAARSRRSTPS